MNEAPLSLAQRFKLSRFFRGEEPVIGPIKLNQRRIFILPSRSGLLFIGLIVLILLIAFVYNNNLAYMLGFLLASIFFVTILHSFKSLDDLVIRAGYNQPAFAGASAGFTFHIDNPTDQARFAIDVRLQDKMTINLAPQQTQTLTLHRTAERRGWQNCGTLTLSCRYPLGLFKAWSPLRFDSQALIYPMPTANGLPFPENLLGHGAQGQNRQQGDEFFGLKAYQSSDSIRQIHWKSFAKGRGLHSKQYIGASSSDLWLDFDSAPGNHLEERLSQLCRWLIDAEQAGLRYGLVLPGVKLAPDAGQAHYKTCLRLLALF